MRVVRDAGPDDYIPIRYIELAPLFGYCTLNFWAGGTDSRGSHGVFSGSCELWRELFGPCGVHQPSHPRLKGRVPAMFDDG